ncbi:MAG: hypothetical protein PVJ67_03365 [Candidatus Pacearchaeota archaeon]|jgi:hypothetical protein
MQKCMYCGCEITDDRQITVCDKCGMKVWGEKMFNAIKQNMSDAKERGDLCHTPSVKIEQSEMNNSENQFNL